jgi:glutamyl-tRNA synthetase
MEEMTQLFDIKDVNKSASAFNADKLAWLNQQHIMRATPERLALYLKPQLAALGIQTDDDRKIASVAKVLQERAKTMREMAESSRFFFSDVGAYEEKAAKKILTADAVTPLQAVHDKLSSLQQWQANLIHDAVAEVAATLAVGLGKVAQPIRVAVSGSSVSPPIDTTLEALGRETTLARILNAINFIKSTAHAG